MNDVASGPQVRLLILNGRLDGASGGVLWGWSSPLTRVGAEVTSELDGWGVQVQTRSHLDRGQEHKITIVRFVCSDGRAVDLVFPRTMNHRKPQFAVSSVLGEDIAAVFQRRGADQDQWTRTAVRAVFDVAWHLTEPTQEIVTFTHLEAALLMVHAASLGLSVQDCLWWRTVGSGSFGGDRARVVSMLARFGLHRAAALTWLQAVPEWATAGSARQFVEAIAPFFLSAWSAEDYVRVRDAAAAGPGGGPTLLPKAWVKVDVGDAVLGARAGLSAREVQTLARTGDFDPTRLGVMAALRV